MTDKTTSIQQIREALEESWKIVYSSCVMCDKRTCPLGEHSEQPQCNRFPNEDRECHIKQSIIKSNEALLTLQGKVIVDEGDLISLYNNGYLAGHHDTVEGDFVDIFSCDMTTYHEDVVKEIISDLTKEDSDETT